MSFKKQKIAACGSSYRGGDSPPFKRCTQKTVGAAAGCDLLIFSCYFAENFNTTLCA
ncbi:hypothetical protein PS898_04927 [Pseudomonas fluorescens]|nr:hypothetical protein PS898_04927 [Pseudomonas fluorescens]